MGGGWWCQFSAESEALAVSHLLLLSIHLMQPIRESVDSLCRDDTNAQYMQKTLKIIKNGKGCRDGMAKSTETR